MALTHLVDTSVLTPLKQPAFRAAVEQLADSDRLRRAGISDLEIGHSASHTRERDCVQEALTSLELVETTAAHVPRARQVQRRLTARRQRGRKVPDLLVAAAAEASKLTVLHYDADFARIAAVTGQKCG